MGPAHRASRRRRSDLCGPFRCSDRVRGTQCEEGRASCPGSDRQGGLVPALRPRWIAGWDRQDPPAFIKNKKGLTAGTKAYRTLFAHTLRKVRPGGRAVLALLLPSPLGGPLREGDHRSRTLGKSQAARPCPGRPGSLPPCPTRSLRVALPQVLAGGDRRSYFVIVPW